METFQKLAAILMDQPPLPTSRKTLKPIDLVGFRAVKPLKGNNLLLINKFPQE